MSMIKNHFFVLTTSLFLALNLFACGGTSDSQTSESVSEKTSTSLTTTTSSTTTTATTSDISQQTPFAYVSRSVNNQTNEMGSRLTQSVNDFERSPVEFVSPYQFNSGAALHVKSGLDVNALDTEVLTAYFGTSNYDVKDLSVDVNGQRLVFAARGDDNHPTDSTWNIFIYNFATKQLSRVISSDLTANSGQDTSPIITADNKIIFSSDRDAGNPAKPRPNSDLVGSSCRKVDPRENPSLIHSMSIDGQDITQLTFGRKNHDLHTARLKDGRVAFIRWEPEYQLNAMCQLQNNPLVNITETAKGLDSPTPWSEAKQCDYSKVTQNGVASVTNNFKILALSADGSSLQQLYQTTTTNQSAESFLNIEQLIQAENGQLIGVLRHQYNSAVGGDLIELDSGTSNSSEVFSELKLQSLTEPTVDLYPGELSLKGWFSALSPYRDGSSRLLVSWAQCIIQENGTSRFCTATDSSGLQSNRYGIWVYNPATQDRSPIVRSADDAVYSDIAMARPHTGSDLNGAPFNANFVDNPDATRIVCNANNAPIANAGVDQTIYLGDVVTLDGSQSSDADGDELTYHWQIVSQAAQSSPQLEYPTMIQPTLTLDKTGTYIVSLVVDDGESKSPADTVTIEVRPRNQAPIANAGPDQSVIVNSLVTLNGSASSDPDNDSLSYSWQLKSQPAGSNISLSQPGSVTPQFTATNIGEYQFDLVVNDGTVNSTADSVKISVTAPPNQKPVANAGADKQAYINQAIQLDGTQSFDPDNDPLSYQWSIVSQPVGATFSLQNSGTATPTFSGDVAGTYRAQLIVNDGKINSNADFVDINLLVNENAKPIADAGADSNGYINQLLQLNGAASYDPEGAPLSYSWTVISSPTASQYQFTDATKVDPQFSGDTVGNYVIQLVVNDGVNNSLPDTVLITLSKPNTRPVANAGPDQMVQLNQTIMLDGSASSDSDGDPLTYQWTIISPANSGAILSNATSVSPSVSISSQQSLVIQLIVNDGKLDSDPDLVELNFDNTRPVADAGDDQHGSVGDLLTLDGSNSRDADGDPLTYAWTLISAPADSAAQLSDSHAVMPTISLDQEGNYVFQLIVNDGQVDSDADTVTLSSTENTRPVADAGNNQSLAVGGQAMLDGSGSFDADGDDLSYRWNLISQPTNSTAALINADQVAPSLNIDVSGDYVVQLIVNDGQVDSLADTMLISTQNLPPIADAGVEQTVDTDVMVTLDGSASHDPEGAPLSYRWSLISQPESSTVTLNNPTDVMPEFNPDSEGVYVVQLVVNDGLFDSLPDTVSIEVINIPQVCELYPITLPEELLANLEVDEQLSNILLGNGYGNYSWLSWNGSNSANTLAVSLVPPGNSQNYINPLDDSDRHLDLNDWVHGAPGVKNSRKVRDALNHLLGREIVIPVWSETTGQGSQFRYHVQKFARIIITDYKLCHDGTISLIFKGFTQCGN